LATQQWVQEPFSTEENGKFIFYFDAEDIKVCKPNYFTNEKMISDDEVFIGFEYGFKVYNDRE